MAQRDGGEATAALVGELDEARAELSRLRRSVESYRGLVENVRDLIWRTDQRGRVLYVNTYVEEFLGFTVAEMLGQSVDAYCMPESVPRLTEAVREALRGSPPLSVFSLVLEYRRKDGGPVPAELRVSVERDSAGRVMTFAGVSRDLSSRLRAKAALRESEGRHRRLFDSSRDAVMTLEPPLWRFTSANLATLAMFGARDEAHFTSLGPAELSPERQPGGLLSAETAAEMIETAARLGSHAFEWMHRRVSGEVFPASVLLSRADLEGKLVLQATVRDITEHKRAEAALRANEQFYQDIFENSPAVKLLIDPGSGRVVQANAAACAFYGYQSEALTALHIWDINALGEAGTRRRLALAESAQQSEFDARHRLASGAIREVRVYCGRVKAGEQVLLHSIILDVTDRKRAEEERCRLEGQLHQAQKMESVGRLAGGVAHDFNNMLAVILANAEMALEQVDCALPLHADLSEIKLAALRSAGLTRQLLAFARQQTIAPRALELNAAIAGMMKMLQRLIGEDITLAWLPAEGLWLVKADPSQLDQILANLCVNARDAISGVGKLTIESSNLTLDSESSASHGAVPPGDYVRLAVSDDGCGMDSETLAHLFEPFFTTKRPGEGTGLGLATVYGIVKQNAGFIEVSSVPGAGTTFILYLPRHEGTAELAGRAVEVSAPRGHETILLVEDESALLRATARTLEGQGYTVLAVSAPEEALRLATEHPRGVQLLVTDVVMPGMNGRDLASRLLALCPDLKLLFISGYTADVIGHHGVLEEGVNFLQKPFSAQALAAKVREVLRREDALLPASGAVS